MVKIKEMFEEVKFEMFKVVLLGAFLDSAIFFLISYLVLSVFSIGILIPLLAAIIYLVIRSFFNMKKISLKEIEKRNPSVKEMLRTASDNQEEDSFMARALFEEVLDKMKAVSSGSFISLKQMMKKLVVIFIISSLLFTIAFFNINISKFENPFANVNLNFFQNKQTQEKAIQEAGLVTLGSGKIDINLKQNLNQIDFNSVSNPEDTGALADELEGDVNAKASKAYTKSLDDINDRKTAAEYSQKIK